MAIVAAVVVMSPPSQVPSLDTTTQLWGRARRAGTRSRSAVHVTQNRSSRHTKRCITPIGQPSRFVHITQHSVCASYNRSRLPSSTPTSLTSR